MPPKRSKKTANQPDPNRLTTRPKNAATHPGQVVHDECSNKRPESVILAEKAEKAARRARKEQQSINQDKTANEIAEYEHDMVISDAFEDTGFPRHRNEAGRENGPTKQLNDRHRSTSGTKRKIEDNQSFEIVDNDPEVDSGVEKEPKSKRTRVSVVPADATRHNNSEAMEVESDEAKENTQEDVDSSMSELTDTETVNEETPKPKKTRPLAYALRRTETYIEQNENENLEDDTWMLEPEGLQVEEYRTPKPNKKQRAAAYHTDLEEDVDDSDFVSPLRVKAHRKPAAVADSENELTGTDDGGLEAKKKGDKKTRAFREMVQKKRAEMTTSNNKQVFIKPTGNKVSLSSSHHDASASGDNRFDGNHGITNNNNSESTFPTKKKTQEVKKVARKVVSSQGEDNLRDNRFDGDHEVNNDNSKSTFRSKKKTQEVKKVARKVVSSQGEDDLRDNMFDGDCEVNESTFPTSKKKTQEVKKVARKVVSSQGEDNLRDNRTGKVFSSQWQGEDDTLQTRMSLSRQTEGAQPEYKLVERVSDDAPAKPPSHDQQVKKGSKNISTLNMATTASRTTASNPVSVAKASKPPAAPKKLLATKVTVKPDSISIKTANGDLSGDDDQKERDDMLASPVKGSDAQAASTGLIKLEKTNEKPKSMSRSKAELLQLEKDDLIVWKNTIEPNYVKYYLTTKTLWSADPKLLEIAQSLYDETLGYKKPMVLTTSSGPIKQLNQKLNDIRNQAGKFAITVLDASFLEVRGPLEDYTPKSAATMRIKFAQDLLEGYKFLFGPDVEYEDGSRMKGKRFFNELILQMFASVFKHTVGRVPPNFPQIGHPIVALALACVSVERAVRIWAEGIYDANTGKIVAKINPLSNKPSRETAFSSNIWADATNKYVAKIATLKDDFWKELMDEAANHGVFTWEGIVSTSGAALDPHATDRDRALFSDED